MCVTFPIARYRKILHKFDIVQAPINIEFDQLVKIIRALPARQLRKLKIEIDKQTKRKSTNAELEALLLNGPVATDKQLEKIENNRKQINQWRTN